MADCLWQGPGCLGDLGMLVLQFAEDNRGINR
jgi:hypothetical protein